jgi:hypothetical protein
VSLSGTGCRDLIGLGIALTMRMIGGRVIFEWLRYGTGYGRGVCVLEVGSGTETQLGRNRGTRWHIEDEA